MFPIAKCCMFIHLNTLEEPLQYKCPNLSRPVFTLTASKEQRWSTHLQWTVTCSEADGLKLWTLPPPSTMTHFTLNPEKSDFFLLWGRAQERLWKSSGSGVEMGDRFLTLYFKQEKIFNIIFAVRQDYLHMEVIRVIHHLFFNLHDRSELLYFHLIWLQMQSRIRLQMVQFSARRWHHMFNPS